jgi:hypothetical protein
MLPLGSGTAVFTPLGSPWGNLLGCEVAGVELAAPCSLVLEVASSELATLTQEHDLVDLMIVAEYSATTT